MNLVRLLLTAILLQVFLVPEAQTINLTIKDIPLQDVFTIIKKQTGVLFFYDAALLKNAKPVSVDLKNAGLETALNEVLKNQGLNWVLEDKTVTIVENPFEFTKPVGNPGVQKLSGRVNGSVTDIEGNTINGVSVLVKGSKQGTISDEAGKFSIVADHRHTLVFSSVNYSTQEVKVIKDEMKIVLQMDLKPMEAMVIGGNMNSIKRKSEVTSVTVLDVKMLEKIPANTLEQVFRGWAPGVNSFDVGPESEGFPSLSIRGAGGPTSLSVISVYVDGIEYAGGSGYLSQLDKTNVDRIEIVRGPGAATLYGTGSNGGIVQIFTKTPKATQTEIHFSSAAGFYKSKWVSTDAFQQLHTLETSTGLKHGSLTLGGSYRTVGAYLPDGGEKNKGFYGNVKMKFGRLQVLVSGRYNVRNFHLSRSPVFDTTLNPRQDIIVEPEAGLKVPAYIWFNVRPRPSRNKDGITETSVLGVNLSHQTSSKWVNNLVAGYTENSSKELPVSGSLTSLQTAYSADEYQTSTVRYSNVLRLADPGKSFAATITSGAEYRKFSYSRTITRATAARTFLSKDPDNENYGAFVQLNPSYKNVYLTTGIRYEKNNLFKATWNPRIGLTTNFETSFLIFKPRISWGRGISAPDYQQRFGQPANAFSVIYANPDLKAQRQEGFDYGLELYDKKGTFRFEVVYYDNVLKDMIGDQSLGNVPGDPGLQAFIYKNVGEVANRGWEFLAEWKTLRFNFRGTFSIMNAVLEDTTGAYHFDRYTGNPPGTRLIYLPKHTAGLSMDYNFYKIFRKADKGFVSLSITEVDGIKYFDTYAYYVNVAYGREAFNPAINYYEAESKPVFRVGLYAEYQVLNELRFYILGSNILNSYKYEFYNQYPTHGATWLFGLKFNLSSKQ